MSEKVEMRMGAMVASTSACPKVAVVIPYFQRKLGLLSACVASILAQEADAVLQIVVIDDCSPLPARQELASLVDDTRVHVLLQANAGPGAARNRGIEMVDADTELVAFLDSDDCWEPGFLDAALKAFNAGCDMFFGNSRRFGQDKTRFEWSAGARHQLRSAEHRCIDARRQVYVYEGDFFDFAVHRSGIISTSTLIYRYAALPALRFNTALFNGQDRYFKLQLAQRSARVGFCTAVGATEGQGVNIFDSSGWGSEKGLRLLYNYIRLAKLILRSLPLKPAQRRHVRAQLAENRLAMTSTLLHLMRQGKPVDWAVLGRTLRDDPQSLLFLLPNILRVLSRRAAAAGTQS